MIRGKWYAIASVLFGTLATAVTNRSNVIPRIAAIRTVLIHPGQRDSAGGILRLIAIAARSTAVQASATGTLLTPFTVLSISVITTVAAPKITSARRKAARQQPESAIERVRAQSASNGSSSH